MAAFPPIAGLQIKEDSAKGKEGSLDGVMRQDTEGGWQTSRPRTTRRDRRVFETGFTNITLAEKEALQTFEANNTGRAFTYDVPYSGETVTVTFQGRITYNYKGFGGAHRWDTDIITLREV